MPLGLGWFIREVYLGVILSQASRNWGFAHKIMNNFLVTLLLLVKAWTKDIPSWRSKCRCSCSKNHKLQTQAYLCQKVSISLFFPSLQANIIWQTLEKVRCFRNKHFWWTTLGFPHFQVANKCWSNQKQTHWFLHLHLSTETPPWLLVESFPRQPNINKFWHWGSRSGKYEVLKT